MNDTALKKFLKELATGEPILVSTNQQKKYLRQIAEQADQELGVEMVIATRSQAGKEVELPILKVQIKSEDNGNYEYDSFYLGFTPKDKTLYISTQRNYDSIGNIAEKTQTASCRILHEAGSESRCY